MADPVKVSWRFRLLVAEAIIRLVTARFLVRHVPFRHWRGFLGQMGADVSQIGLRQVEIGVLVKAIERADARLPFACKCLPRAMALHAMMRRRGISGELVIGVLESARRGSIEDLHAWVETGGEILIGDVGERFHPIVRFV